MNEHTTQEIYDQIVNHLRKQNKQAMTFDDEGRMTGCFYRSPNGMSCAVGCLITDEEYEPDMEMKDVYHLNSNDLLPERLTDHLRLLASMQLIHDSYEPIYWEEHFRGIANRFDLEYREPT